MPMTEEEFQQLQQTILSAPPSWEVESVEDKKTGYMTYLADMAKGVATGVQGAVEETAESAGQLLGTSDAVREAGGLPSPISLIAEGVVAGIEQYGLEDPETLPGQLVDGAVQFLSTFLPLNRAAKGVKGMEAIRATTAGKITETAVIGSVADAFAFDEGEQRLSNLVQSFPMLQNPVTDYLSAKEGDKGFEAKARQVMEGMLAGPLVDGVIGGIKALKKLRADKIASGDIKPVSPLALPDPVKGGSIQSMAMDTTADIDTAITKLAGKKKTQTRLEVEAEADQLFTTKPINDAKEQTRLLKTELRFDPWMDMPKTPVKDLPPAKQKALNEQARQIRRRKALVQNHLSTQIERAGQFNTALRKLAVADDAAVPALKEEIKESLSVMRASQKAAHKLITDLPARVTSVTRKRLRDINKQAADLEKSLSARMKDVDQIRAKMKPFQALQSRMGVKSLGSSSLSELQTVAGQMDKLTESMTKISSKTEPTTKLELAKSLMTYFHLADRLTGGTSSTAKRMESLTLAGKGEGSRAEMARLLDVHYDIDLGLVSESLQLLPTTEAKHSALLHLKKRVAQREANMTTRTKGSAFLPNIEGSLPANSQAKAPPTQLGRREAKSNWDAMQRAVVEGYVMGLFSGIKTQALNAVGNTAVVAWAPAERLGASLVPGSGIPIGEAGALVKGAVEGIREGIRLAATTLRTGKEQILKSSKIDFDKGQAISAIEFGMDPNTGSGKLVDILGEIVRLPGRGLLAGDQFFKAVNMRAEIHAQAYRQATKEGLSGEAFSARYAEILQDPAPNIKEAAEDFAFTNTFTKQLPDGGPASKAVEALNSIPALRILFPVVRTPVNIMKYLGIRTPLAPLAQSVRADLAAGGSRRAEAISRIALGSSVMAGGMALWSEGFITGQGPSEPSTARVWRMSNQEYSVKIGDQWVRYDNIEPLGAFLKIGARAAEIISATEPDSDEQNKAVAVVSLAATAFLTENWLMTIGDLFEAVNSNRPDKMERFIESMGKSFTPAVLRDFERTVAPQLSATEGFLEEIAANIPGLSDDLPGRYDYWGQPANSSERLGPDFISPFLSLRPDGSPAANEMVRLGMGTRLPTRTVQGVEITEAERQRLLQIRGELGMKEAVSQLVSSSEYSLIPDDRREVAIKQVIRQYTEAARQQLLSENPQILQAIANKGRQPQIAN